MKPTPQAEASIASSPPAGHLAVTVNLGMSEPGLIALGRIDIQPSGDDRLTGELPCPIGHLTRHHHMPEKSSPFPFSVIGREEGRGKPFETKFATLGEAAVYIKEYMDGVSGFHTDSSSYETKGFTLRDLGKFVRSGDGFRDFVFTPPPRPTPQPPFSIEETITAHEAHNDAPVIHQFGTLDEARGFIMALQDHVRVSGNNEFSEPLFEPDPTDGTPMYVGSKTYKTIGFELADVGKVESSADGEVCYVEVFGTPPRERLKLPEPPDRYPPTPSANTDDMIPF